MADDSAEMESGLLENVQFAIRRNIELAFVKKAKIEFKGDRSEARILALSAHRFYVLTCSKNGCKVDFSMHILEIRKIESSKPLLLTLSCDDKSHEKSYYFRVAQPRDTIEIIAHILASLKFNFPSGSPDRLLRVVYGPPEESEERQAQVTTLVNNLRNTEGDVETGPCGGYSQVYVSISDFYGQPHLEEVVWDIDTIYLSLNSKELNIQDFDHLEQKDLVPIISTLEYNDWFTKLTCDSFKLGSEVCDAILRVIKKSPTIEELVLDNVSLGRDYCQKLALALTSNPKTSLHSLSLSSNSVEDRGLVHLSGVFSKLPHGLVSLSLADNGITSKGAISLGQALRSNKYNESSLQRLDLSRNLFKGDGVAGLCDFLAQPNTLTHLNLSETECPLDLLFGALIRGCVQQLAYIHLAGNNFTSKKSKDAVVPPSFQQFFSSSQALKLLDVSDCKLHADAIRAILKGLSENTVLSDVELNISSNELRGPGAKAIAENISKLKSVGRLDISDNGFEGDLVKILEKMSSNKSIKYLNLGENTKHSRSSATVVEALVQLICEENSQLESISLAESKLKEDIIPLLDALGTNESVKELDISGNQMGDEGARCLAKALQINSKLRTLDWDKNGTTYRGFADIAAALKCNYTLLSMPMPLYDAAQSLKPQTEQHLRTIEKLLLRNQSPHKVVTDQAYRLQQGLLLASTQQQMVDRLVVQLQDLISDLRLSKDTDVKNEIKTAKHFIQDADKLKQLLLKFHLCTNDSDIETRFAELSTEFYKAAEEKMKSNRDKMIDCAKEVCPYITSADDVKSRLEAVVEGKPQLSETFVEEVILTQAASGIANRLSEDKLTVASVMVDTIMEMMIHQLEASVTKLDLLLQDHRIKMEEVEKGAEKSADEDDVAAVARKARNRLSSSQLVVPTIPDGTDSGGRSHKRRPTVSRRPTHARVAEEDEEKEKEDKEVVKVVKEEVETKPPPKLVVKTDFVDVEPQPSALKHLVKDRARPPQKRRLPTRPSNRPAVANGSGQENGEEQEDIEVFWNKTVEAPAVEVTPPTKKTSTSKTPPATTQAPPPSKTSPPKPTPKPKPSPKAKVPEETKKSGWIPKGVPIPGFLKKKNRDRSSTAPDTTEVASTAWYTSDVEKKKKGDSAKESRNRAASEKKPVVTVERTSSDMKANVTKERVPSEKKPEVSKEATPPEKKKEESKEKVPPEKKPEVTPTEKKPEVTPTEKKAEVKVERRTSDKKPEVERPIIMGVKPFALSRDRATTETGLRPSPPQPRDRAASSDKVAAKTTPDEPAAAPAPAPAKRPPKFGVGIGGVAGGGLLAEMKLRQERAASLGRNKAPEKPAETKPADKPDTGSKEKEAEVAKERLVKPSSFKRPRLPSGTPPKPAPRPKRESKEEKKVERPEEQKEEKPEKKKVEKPEENKLEKTEEKKGEKQEQKKEEEPEEKKVEKPEEKELEEKREEKPAETKEEKPEEKNVEEAEKKPEVEGKKNEAVGEDKTEKEKAEETQPKIGVNDKERQPSEKETEVSVDKVVDKVEKSEVKKEEKPLENKENVDGKPEKEERRKSETKQEGSLDDLWLKQEPGRQALRPGGRSNSLKVQRTSSTEKVTTARSATLPKPWSPGQAPSSMLSRKLSWELPKVGDDAAVRGAKKDRSDNRGEDTIQEDAEEQNSKTSTVASKEEEKAGKKEKSEDETKDTKENGAVPKSPGVVTLEDILASDGDTTL